MCYFLTIGLPQTAVALLQRSLPGELTARQTHNPSITAVLPQQYAAYTITSGGCSCDLFSPVLRIQQNKQREQKLVQKYRKKGWSEHKIERAISQTRKDKKVGRVGVRSDVLKLVSALLPSVNELFLLVHWYGGDLERERFSVTSGPSIAGDLLTQTEVIGEEDTIYRFAGSR